MLDEPEESGFHLASLSKKRQSWEAIYEPESAVVYEDRDLEEVGRAARAGDPQALEELCSRLRVSFVLLAKRRIGNQDTAEDLAHDALAVVAERVGAVASNVDVVPWCLTVLRNVVGNYYMAKRRSERLLPWAPGLAERWHGGVTREREAAKEEISEALPRLGPRCRQLLEWKLAGMSAGEMQARLGLPNKNALYMRFHRCRQELKRVLEAERKGE